MNPEDFEGDLERLHGASYAWALACCRRDREEAGDVLQESYLKILDGRARFEGGSSFKTFLFGVIRRTAAENRRRAWRRGLLMMAWGRSRAEAEAPAAGVEERDSRLPAALAALAGRQREVLELVFAHDMTVEEASRTLGISVGSARVHYDRGKKRLRLALLTAAAAILAFAVSLALFRPEPQAEIRIAEWKSPTDFLLAAPYPDLLGAPPALPEVPDYAPLLAPQKGTPP